MVMEGTKKTTALRAIREKCIDCSGGSKDEVRKCVIPECPLYPFRLGKNPNLKPREYTEEQRRAIAERLASNLKRKSAG